MVEAFYVGSNSASHWKQRVLSSLYSAVHGGCQVLYMVGVKPEDHVFCWGRQTAWEPHILKDTQSNLEEWCSYGLLAWPLPFKLSTLKWNIQNLQLGGAVFLLLMISDHNTVFLQHSVFHTTALRSSVQRAPARERNQTYLANRNIDCLLHFRSV